MFVYRKYARIIMTAMIFIILVTGLFQTLYWMYRHTKNNRDLSRYTRAISMTIKNNTIGRGVFVSDERYGSMSYALYGLANAPKVLVRKPNSTISEQDVEDADWILFGKEYVADFDYTQAIEIQPFKFFPRNSGISIVPKESR